MCGRTGDGWSEMKKWMNPLKNEESSQKWRPRHRCFIRIHWGVKNGERNGAMRTGTHATSGLNHSQPMTPTKLAWHQVQSFLLISPFHRAFGNLTAVIYLSESDDRAGSDWQRWSRRGSWSRLLPDQRKARTETVSTRNVRHRVHTQCGIVRPKHDRAWCGQSDCDGQPHNHSHFRIVLLVMMSELENRNVILYENKKKGHNYELRSQRRRGFLKISFPVIYSYVCVCVYLYM